MNQAIRDQIKTYMDEARELAHKVLTSPRSEREYMLACGRYQQLIADAKALRDRFLEAEVQSQESERELPEDDADEVEFDPPPAPVRRPVRPQPDRLAAQRARHIPRGG